MTVCISDDVLRILLIGGECDALRESWGESFEELNAVVVPLKQEATGCSSDSPHLTIAAGISDAVFRELLEARQAEGCVGAFVILADDDGEIARSARAAGLAVLPKTSSLAQVLAAATLQSDRFYSRRIEQLRAEALERARTLEDARGKAEDSLRQLQAAQSQLLQSEKMASIGLLAAGVAHEINNPIGFIYSNMNTLRDYVVSLKEFFAACREIELPPPQQGKKDGVGVILDDLETLVAETIEGAERVKRIVTDLRSFSRAEDDKMTTADLNKGLESTINVCWNELKYRCKVAKEFGDIPALCCYPTKLNQVFMNLIINASHAMEKSGTVTVRTFQEGNEICVQISDDGCGIPPENLPRIFDPFFTTKPVGKGTGLGLSIAYNIIAEHDGRIDVQSEVGKGSTFTIRLPIRE